MQWENLPSGAGVVVGGEGVGWPVVISGVVSVGCWVGENVVVVVGGSVVGAAVVATVNVASLLQVSKLLYQIAVN